jgi:hypothetical protein
MSRDRGLTANAGIYVTDDLAGVTDSTNRELEKRQLSPAQVASIDILDSLPYIRQEGDCQLVKDGSAYLTNPAKLWHQRTTTSYFTTFSSGNSLTGLLLPWRC